MSIVYSSELLKITEDRKTSVITIDFTYPSKVLIHSIIKPSILKGCTTSSDFKTIKFKAYSIKTFNDFRKMNKKVNDCIKLSINDILKMSKSLVSQLNYLIKYENRTVFGYSPEDVFVINENQYIFMNSDYFTEIYGNQLLISYPITDKKTFWSPELLQIKEVPSYIHYKSCYYSLGSLLLYGLSDDEDIFEPHIYKNEKENTTNIAKIYQSIRNTKIYWFIKKCLHEEPENRCILFL